MTALLLVHAGATLAMCGLGWFVQVVHYPLFAHVGTESFAAYEREHTRRTTWLVMPLMLVEAFIVVALLVFDASVATALGAALLAAIWLSTFLVQVPCHRVLERGWSSPVHTRLVRTNWVRTALWTTRSAIVLALIV